VSGMSATPTRVPEDVAPVTQPQRVLRVAVLGKGAVGGPVVAALRSGAIPGTALAAVIDSRGASDALGGTLSLAQLAERTDLVVEAAGQRALAEAGPGFIAAGLDLFALSIGALADEDLHRRLSAGPGRLYLSTGAIGGLDVIRALSDAGTLDQVRIETTKLPRTLVQDWMDDGERARVLEATARTEILRGSPQRIATAFPKSANVAMAVATAVGDPERVEAAVYADPQCDVTTHEITVHSATGDYWFRISNLPSPDNPATSGLVPLAVVRALHDLAGRRETVI